MKPLALAAVNTNEQQEGISLEPGSNAAAERTTRLFTELRNPLCRYLLTLGLSREEVEEVAQESFLRLYKHLRGKGSEESIRGWLFRVGHNLARNERKRRRRVDWQPLSDASDLAADAQSTPENQVLERSRMDRVESALLALPEQQRQCLHLRAEGLRYREIAAVLEVSVSTVANLLQRGLETLGRKME